jgi:isopentenyl diphosphate isomerase/L-lactate dehydrogenase-like FMN-dependent dehydrogenase
VICRLFVSLLLTGGHNNGVVKYYQEVNYVLSMKYNARYPSVADLARRASKRIPRFVLDYLEGGIGDETLLRRNRQDLDKVLLWPRYLQDVSHVHTQCDLFGKRYDLGFGVSPVGLGDLMWPDIEACLASAAQNANIPYILSTMSTTPMERIANLAPDVAWFQLYVPKDIDTMKDLIVRAHHAGFQALVITVDIPVGAKRDRELKNGLNLPFRLTPKLFLQIVMRPEWAIRTLFNGIPGFVNLQPYGNSGEIKHLGEFLTSFFMSGVTTERIKMIRELWPGPLIIKGLQRRADVETALQLGIDGIVVSNHAGRQLDAAPSSIQALRSLPDAIKARTTLMLDSGIRSGLDVIRARAVGAECCFSGRSFFYGVTGAGADGGRQVVEIFRDEITRTLQQIGCIDFMSLDASWLQE